MDEDCVLVFFFRFLDASLLEEVEDDGSTWLHFDWLDASCWLEDTWNLNDIKSIAEGNSKSVK